ncbi:hypothetical protein H6P81_005136 [Aristolochia fimbriata]|uniref:Peroxidase n=1 Tax=Aristolochia fimbriata TaxID=158543 RepID=A0AAV7EX53_ARIFI|nr:hypothetical protein H6P81_005136 [Aristolochia fimbriata]
MVTLSQWVEIVVSTSITVRFLQELVDAREQERIILTSSTYQFRGATYTSSFMAKINDLIAFFFAAVTLSNLLGRARVTEAYDTVPLVPGYYGESCPVAEKIVREQVKIAIRKNPRIAASLLRLHFHDCFVMGCDASVLLDNGVGVASEKDAGPNRNSLRGFDVVDKTKSLLEKACPGTVSCADLLAIAARDAVNLRGGPYWKVELGRRDSLTASQTGANQYIPSPNSTLEMLVANFAVQGLSPTDLVVLSGSHTIGRSRCLSFKQRIYAGAGEEEYYYDRHRRYTGFRRILRSICPRSTKRDNALVPLDFMTSTRFDNAYFRNVLQGKGLLQTDNVLITEDTEGGVSKLVWRFAADQELFFREFPVSIVKMGRINPLVGEVGEIRRNCRALNAW